MAYATRPAGPEDKFCHDSARASANCYFSRGEHPGARLVRARQIAAAATASLLVVAAFSVSAAHAQAKAPPACEDAAGLAVPASPLAPWKGAPLRVVVAVEQAFEGELSLTAPDGTVAAKSREREGGPPYF